MHKLLPGITFGLVFSCLNAWSVEVLEIIPTPAPEFPLNGAVKSEDGTQVLEIEVEDGGELQRLRFRGHKGLTEDWEIPSWMKIRSIIFTKDAAWFMIWCYKSGASLPVCLGRCSFRDKDGLVFFDDTVDDVRIRGLVSQEGRNIVAVGGLKAGQVKHDEKYSGKWLRIHAPEDDFSKISREKVLEIWRSQMKKLREL